MTDELTNAEKVARGAKLLDEKFPDWFHHIDFSDSAYNFGNAEKCTLGQLARQYDDSTRTRWANGYEYMLGRLGLSRSAEEDSFSYGFSASHCYKEAVATEFRGLWKAAVDARLERAGLSEAVAELAPKPKKLKLADDERALIVQGLDVILAGVRMDRSRVQSDMAKTALDGQVLLIQDLIAKVRV